MLACYSKNEDLVFDLLEIGADINLKNSQGKSALDVLNKKESLPIKLNSLKESEALLNDISQDDNTSLSL